MTIKIKIDRDECIMCASCEDVCPDIFILDEDDGLAAIVEKYRKEDLATGEVPDNLEDCAIEGAESCPVEIIHVENE